MLSATLSFLSSNLLRIHKISFVFISLTLLLTTSCVDLDFDQPPPGGFDPNIPVTTTIAELKAGHVLGEAKEIEDDLTISGIVISNDAAGNFFKQLVIQDETGGIEIRIEVTDLFNVYPVGRKVYVKLKGLWIDDYNGLIQLGAGYDAVDDELLRIPESLVDEFIIPATYGHPVVPVTLALNELTFAHVSTLVRFSDVQFVSEDAGETWADAAFQQSKNLDIEDCSRRRLIVRSSGFASFAGEPTPVGGGELVGVLGIFGSDYQLVIRDLADVNMNGPRCTVLVDESFDSVDDNDDIFLPEWLNVAVKGTRLWRARVFMTNHYAQATAFGDQAAEMETWLITPEIVLNVPKKITFETAKSFYVHDGLSVWITNNLQGDDVEGATWVELDAVLANSQSPDNTFIPSGDIDLSGFTGTVRIGFKYVGSGPGGQTTTFRVDNVKVENL